MNARSKRLDEALAILAAEREPGRCYSYAEIAEACGCTAEAIRAIEFGALAKLRGRLRRLAGDELKDWTRA